MRKIFLLLGLLLIAPVVQAGADKLEVTVHTGWSFLSVEQRTPVCTVCEVDFFGVTTTVDSSPLIGTKFGYYLNSNAEVEGRFSVSPSHKVVSDNSFVCPPGVICPLSSELYFPFFHLERNMVAYEYGGNFVYNFTQSNVRPFATFGVGGVSSDVDSNTQHDFAFQVGGGAKFYFNNLGLRFEVLDQVIPNYALSGKTEHDVQVQYGVVFRLR